MCSSSELDQAYEALRKAVKTEVTAGRLERALELSADSVTMARQIGSEVVIDTAVCIHIGLLMARGEGHDEAPKLRRILMRSSAPSVQFSASYLLSQFHDQQEELDKCRFYSDAALRYATLDDNLDSQAQAHNRLANLDLLESYFDRAEQGYNQALELKSRNPDPQAPSLETAKILSNLGYCQAVLGKTTEAFRSLTTSLRMMRSLAAAPWFHLPMLGLSFTYLEIGRYERAVRYAERALMNAEAGGSYQLTQVKNALYLLGEAEKLCGRDDRAFQCFFHLQERFYPDQPMVVDVLMATDIRKLINLMA